ncbi:MAG: hypothetical protein EOP62_22885 [Sphingomonadales bacterium]|nr:MAG: hypothetical protein EOP62_22885 [Sphingomonadales bacterium]
MTASSNQSQPVAAKNVEPNELPKIVGSDRTAIATEGPHGRPTMDGFTESAAGVQLLFDRFAKDEAVRGHSARFGISNSVIEIIWALADLAAFDDVSSI